MGKKILISWLGTTDLKAVNQTPSRPVSPGTPSMTAVSILLGKTKYNTLFVQSTKERGGEFVTIP